MRRSGTLATALLAALGVVGCGGPETGTTPKSLCQDETRAAEYAAGLEQASKEGMFTFRLVEADPGPPDRGDNTWTIEILDPSGSPMAADQVEIKAWMPDHGHGTNPLWNEAAEMSPGTYEVGPFDLFMGGFWQFTVEVESGGRTDTAQVGFCLEG